ncbi:MAG TPA: hypothetical protein PKJ96_06300 [Thiobacillaceae bacterium]|nr:hypothetical protein [Thiobacillaceae bacterium]
MIQPVELANFFAVFFSAASVILFGTAYALLFAWSRVRGRPGLMPLAYLAYACLFASVLVLGFTANLFVNGFWTSIVLLMLVGYLVAPHGIWHLCVQTHEQEHEDEGTSVKVYQQR